ncbi:hypothetical protein Hdeb2414_s0028g00699051 [Helianthus debilis subsp. tardiflorus]
MRSVTIRLFTSQNSVTSSTSSSSPVYYYMNYALISALVAFALAQSIKVFITWYVRTYASLINLHPFFFLLLLLLLLLELYVILLSLDYHLTYRANRSIVQKFRTDSIA